MRYLMIFLALSLFACKEQKPDNGWQVTIRGKINNPIEGAISIHAWADTTNRQEPVDYNPADSTFSKTLNLTEPGFYRISFFGQQLVDVILDHADLEINVDGNNQMGFAEVKGSPDVTLMENIEAIRKGFQESEEVAALNMKFADAVQAKDEKQISALQEAYQQALNTSNDSIAAVLEAAAPSLGVINLINSNVIDRERHFDDLTRIAAKFTGAWAGYGPVKEFLAAIAMMKTTAIGQPAPEIALPDQEGKVVKLSSFRGKYVLVDFWAKWCGPCRRENPNLLKAYKQFKSDRFEVIGVSLDRSKSDWLQAIAEDKLEWVHVSDLRYFDSQAAKDYNISSIPYSILVNPEGIIVAKNLRGNALHRTLATFLSTGS
ncbi:MAG: TlpA family protein disulfide reductase [Bacteroidota bacterium]